MSFFSWGSTVSKSRDEDEEPQGVSPGLAKFFPEMTESQILLAKSLCSEELKQSHLFRHWNNQTTPALKRQFMAQLQSLNESYPAGLAGYIQNSRALLAKSKAGENPLSGWKPSVPEGKTFELGTEEYSITEAKGLKEIGKMGFVLVAGGLGERLGYSGIKIGLPTETATGTCYLEFYINYILAIQKKYIPADFGRRLPLCIMTSADTNDATVKLLKKNNYFGMEESQVTIVQQGNGVPALMDNDAKFLLDANNKYKLICKPHGHGDVHALLYEKEVVKRWVDMGIRWITFFQDTNGLAFVNLPLALGVSVENDFIMNTLTVPRSAKQAVGAITKLTNEATGKVRIINVEYNQLDPLLRSNGFDDGDVNDESGYSPYPGNTNQLLFKAPEYLLALDKCKGRMPEFVNPKYKDSSKTTFKKPTRLECMMQDFPTVLEGAEAERVGFTSIAQNLCFSPVKNSTEDGAKLQAKGTHPQCAVSGEADQYGVCRKILQSIGVDIEDGDEETFCGVKAKIGPEIVISPHVMCCPAEFKEAFPNPKDVKISKRSSLVIKGTGKLKVESMNLDGALVVRCTEDIENIVSGVKIANKGWKRIAVDETDDEITAMRGFKMKKVATEEVTLENIPSEECAIL